MKVHLIKRQTIESYVMANPGCKASFRNWLALIKFADWNEPGNIISTFNSADILGKGSDRVIFNIGGNSYRMICKYYFGELNVHLFVKWIGTHAQYTKLCNDDRQYEIELY